MKIIVNTYYEPHPALKKLIDQDGRYVPVNCGSLKNSKDPWVKENVRFEEGDCIADLNTRVNEMTSIYWFWKNFDWRKEDWVGHHHYRRLFFLDDLKALGDWDAVVQKPLTMDFIPDGRLVRTDIRGGYGVCHYASDFELLVEEMKKYYPANRVEEWAALRQMYAPCQMWVMRSKYFDRFCSDSFRIMMPLVSKIDIVGRDNYQIRANAFLQERFTSFWFWNQKKDLRIKEVQTMFFDGWKGPEAKDRRGCYD